MSSQDSERFWRWFNEERGRRNLSLRSIARLAGISHNAISQRESASLPPTYDLCRAIAKAFNMPLEDVLRQAGLLPPKYDENPSARELLWRFMQLSEEEQEFIILTAEALLERKRRREAEEKEQTAKHPEIRPADAGTGP